MWALTGGEPRVRDAYVYVRVLFRPDGRFNGGGADLDHVLQNVLDTPATVGLVAERAPGPASNAERQR